jgi:hypothetical protein
MDLCQHYLAEIIAHDLLPIIVQGR